MVGGCRQLPLAILLSLCYLSLAVNRGNFKTCDQSGFCKRLRATEKDRSPYIVDTVKKVNGSSIEIAVKHESGPNRYRGFLRVLKDRSVRFTMQEEDPVRPRYSPVDSFGPKPLQDGEITLETGSESATVVFGDDKVLITYNPLRIDVFSSSELQISLNARGLLAVETQQLKPKPEEPAPAEEGEEGRKEDEDDLGISAEDLAAIEWEESFKSHHDSNPRGPRAIGLDMSFIGYDKVFGLPEHADNFALKSTADTDPYRLYNLDVFEYELDNPMALYGSIPYITALSKTGRNVGVMWLNAAETWVDIADNSDKSLVGRVLSSFVTSEDISRVDTHFMSESGLLDVFIFLGSSPKDVSRQYSEVFGASYLPSMFSIAYQQCRWNYNDQQDVLNVDENFDKYDIPMDVMWLDIEHTNGKRYFTWDSKKFPDSKGMIDSLGKKGRNMVTIVDPHIKTDNQWSLYKEGTNHPTCAVFVKNKDGADFKGHCWPGSSSWVDYTSPCAREWWANQFSYDKYQGTTERLFTWNDMNEPSVFDGPEVSMPKDNLHGSDWEHRDVHNIFGHYMHRATAEGQIQRSGGSARPFVLSRAFFVGSHRVGPIWTGDNHASWEHLRMSIPMLLSLNVAGYPFVGADVGGFFGNPSVELLTRWYQAAVFQPFLRGHSHIDTKRREPWLFGDEATANIRDALVLRYQLLPYLYTLFYEASIDNSPVMRPLWYEFPEDSAQHSNQKEFLVGSALLSSPVLESGESTHYTTLPGNEVWYNYHTLTQHEATSSLATIVKMSTMPLFIRGGSIVPIKKRLRRSSELMAGDPYTLMVATNSKGEAVGRVYNDDTKTFDYQKGDMMYRELKLSNNKLTNRVLSGSFASPEIERIVILGVGKHTATLNGKPLTVSYDKSKRILTIKKPAIALSSEWTILLE